MVGTDDLGAQVGSFGYLGVFNNANDGSNLIVQHVRCFPTTEAQPVAAGTVAAATAVPTPQATSSSIAGAAAFGQ